MIDNSPACSESPNLLDRKAHVVYLPQADPELNIDDVYGEPVACCTCGGFWAGPEEIQGPWLWQGVS